MNSKQLVLVMASLLTFIPCELALAQNVKAPYVRMAELEIDPAQLDRFYAAIKEGINAAVRVEPGVLVLYAVSEKDNPNRIKVFEVYTDEDAYKVHVETPHFKKFRAATDQMVTSRKLFDAIPIVLGAKAR